MIKRIFNRVSNDEHTRINIGLALLFAIPVIVFSTAVIIKLIIFWTGPSINIPVKCEVYSTTQRQCITYSNKPYTITVMPLMLEKLGLQRPFNFYNNAKCEMVYKWTIENKVDKSYPVSCSKTDRGVIITFNPGDVYAQDNATLRITLSKKNARNIYKHFDIPVYFKLIE